MSLPPDALRLAKGLSIATVVTIMPDGQPQALLTWIDTDGEHLLVNTEPQRRRVLNVRRDPRVTVLMHPADDLYDWAEVRGRVVGEVAGAEAREHIDTLAIKYTGQPYSNVVGPHGRVILKIAADHVNTTASLGH
jgi:PPOX class probable F420-dependent enzyme